MVNKKGTSDFLLTYGWAFIVILCMIVLLAYFGVLNSEKLMSKEEFDPEKHVCEERDEEILSHINDISYFIEDNPDWICEQHWYATARCFSPCLSWRLKNPCELGDENYVWDEKIVDIEVCLDTEEVVLFPCYDYELLCLETPICVVQEHELGTCTCPVKFCREKDRCEKNPALEGCVCDEYKNITKEIICGVFVIDKIRCYNKDGSFCVLNDDCYDEHIDLSRDCQILDYHYDKDECRSIIGKKCVRAHIPVCREVCE